ncbi:MAG: M14 family metallopeptidase [Thermomicrobiales bacterium]
MTDLDNYLIDRNGDGYIDDANVRFVALPDDATDPMQFWSSLIDLAARIGLNAQALPLPLFIAPDAETTIDPVGLRNLEDIESLGSQPEPAQHREDINGNAPPRSTDFLDLFTARGLLEDLDDDRLPDATSFGMTLPDEIPPALGAALCNLAVRIGLESGGVTFPVVADRRASLSIVLNDGPAVLRQENGGWAAEGDGESLPRLIDEIARSWPAFGEPDTAGARAGVEAISRSLSPARDVGTQESRVLWELQWSAEPEVERLLTAIDRDLLPKVQPESDVDLVVFACEPEAVRRRLEQSVSDRLTSKRPGNSSVRVLSAFKAGLSWLMDVVLKELEGQPVERLEVRYQRFEASGTARHLDLSIRWLQELFPGDEIAAQRLGIPLDAISFVEDGSTGSPIYRAHAFDANGDEIGSWECDLLSYSMPFMPNVEGSDHVAVTTGGFIAKVDGECIETRVDTDLDRFWAFWQGDVLKRVVAGINEKGGFSADLQPFFGALEVDVHLSAPNSRLGIREENDSAAEALHEDIYFNTLDTIEELGLQTTGDKTSAPGAVVPFVHVQPGVAPHAVVRLREAPEPAPLPAPVRVANLSIDQGELVAGIEIDAGHLPPDVEQSIVNRLVKYESRARSFAADLLVANRRVRIRLPLPEMISGDDEPEPPPMDRNIHGDQVIEWCGRVAGPDTVAAWIEGESYQGRPIPALSLHSASPGRVWSPVKLSILKPTALIVARHHANEISSTNSALQLAHLVGTDAEWAELIEHLNIVAIPYENADGAALHARLAATSGTETWKHHPARYNALGHEFGEDFHAPDSQFGEARVRPVLWNRWLPDAIVDNHGVPSHEWVQPFAGFGSPPRFRVSYWIPQALIYGIVRHVDDPDYPEHEAAALRLRDVVSAAVRETDIGDLNRQIGASYRRWGQEREPQRFPGEFHDDMLWHFGETPVDPEGRGFNTRYPRTTVLSWVTEVNDETATGDHLEMVARAHLVANRAMLDMLVRAGSRAERSVSKLDDGRIVERFNRPRPLRLD